MSKTKGKSVEELLHEALIPENEQPYKVPDNWVWSRLGIVLDFKGGGTPSKSNPTFWNGDIPWATVKDIKQTYLENTQDTITEEGLKNSSASMASPGELLMITRMSPGKCAITKINTSINQDLKIVKPKIDIPSFFLWMYFNTNISIIESMSTGTTVKGIQIDKLKDLKIALPPLNEQKRIADKVEKLLDKINQAKQLIEEAKETFELRRSAILDMAFRGELTARWRDENKNKMNWQKVRLEELLQPYRGIFDGPFGSNLKSDDYTDTGVRVIRLENIKFLDFDNSKSTFISQEKYSTLEKHTVSEGDIIFSSFISEQIRACLIPALETKAINKADCFCIRPNTELINKEYLLFFFSSNHCYNALIEMVHGATRPRINLTQLKSISVPLPSLTEQEQIVRTIKSLLNKQNVSSNYLNVDNLFDSLKNSILSKAFKSELGTNDPSDKSSINLIKEIIGNK